MEVHCKQQAASIDSVNITHRESSRHTYVLTLPDSVDIQVLLELRYIACCTQPPAKQDRMSMWALPKKQDPISTQHTHTQCTASRHGTLHAQLPVWARVAPSDSRSD
jgi:hypothetical protein